MRANADPGRGAGLGRVGRRRFLQTAAVAAGAVAWARPASLAAAQAEQEELYRLARAEGQLNIYGGGPTAPFLDIGRQYEAAFPGITVNVTGGFSNMLAPAIDAQIAAGNLDVDITILQTLQDFERWKRQGALLPFRPEGFDQIPDGFKDADATSVGVRVNAVGYAYTEPS